MTIRILLVDDHAVVRSGLNKFLLVNKDMALVDEASDGAEAVQMAALHQPVDSLNNNEIAEKLFVSLGTVKFHVSNIFQQLGVKGRVDAVKMALEQKLG